MLAEWTTEQPSHLANEQREFVQLEQRLEFIRNGQAIALGSDRGKDLPIKFPVAFERAVQTANLVNREPAGIAHFCCVECQFTAHVLRHPPVQSKSSPRRNVLPNLPNRPHRQADFFHRLPRHRSFLTLPRLDFTADRRPMSSASDVCRPLNKQNLFPFCDHGDDGVEHGLTGLCQFQLCFSLSGRSFASGTIAARHNSWQEFGRSLTALDLNA